MKHFGRFFFSLFGGSLLVSTFAHPQQPWSNILSSSRAIDWKNAGLPATLPDGETTPNPWTPPTRVACTTAQAGITVPVASGTSFSSILTAMNNCSAANTSGSYLQLASGSFTVSSTTFMNTAPYVTLRGAGAMNTTLTLSATLQFGQGGGKGGGTVSTSPAAGTTSVTLTGVSGTTPTVGNIAWFNQCDTGYTGTNTGTNGGTTCSSGSHTDNGGLFICGGSTVCNNNGTGSGGGGQASQYQYVRITSVVNNGGGSYTIGFSNGLYMPNWSTSNNVGMYWQVQSDVGYGIGLEDMSVFFPNASGTDIQGPAYASWIKGVRFIGSPNNRQLLWPNFGKNTLLLNNYFFVLSPSAPSNVSSAIQQANDSDDLVLNNIEEGEIFIEGFGSQLGNVTAYNYNINNDNTSPFPSNSYQHDSGSSGVSFILNEGNQGEGWDDDDTWGTGNLNTTFRNWYACSSVPFTYSTVKGMAIIVDGFHRFDNAIANVLGGTSQCGTYQGSSGSNGFIYRINDTGNDSLAGTTFMRWLNYDTVNASVQKNSGEVPTTLSGNAAPFENTVPGSTVTAPASFYMDTMGFHPSGGTGLNWWKVCNSSFNASTGSCGGTTTTPPFPSCGPDVTGGNEVNGYCYDNPAAVAYKTLPVDTTYQNSYTITAGTYSTVSGTCSPAPAPCEILTISGATGTGTRLMGRFQISGGACATSGAGTATGAEVYMTYATTTKVVYSLASNPGTCNTGTMLWPDVRQFDERVYNNDPSGTASGPVPPTGLTGSVQ